MNTDVIVMVVLGLATAIGIALTLRGGGRHRLARCALQLGAAVLLYLCLFPPSNDEDFVAGELVLLTPGASESQLAALNASANVVALPGALAPRGTERAPDLGTALRRHPETRQLRVVGGGLPARDRDAARGRVAAFDAAPLPRGLVELDAPASVRAGQVWRIDGRVHDVTGGSVELRDPAGAQVASAALDAAGRFTLATSAKGEGEALFALGVLDRDGAVVENRSLPLLARRGAALKLSLFAGAPDPELKYLRRWAADAGLAIDSRLGLSEGIGLHEGTPTLDAAALQATDLLIIDERAWVTLDATQKRTLADAVRAGLGLLLRVTGPIPPSVAADWTALGFRTRVDETAAPVVLGRTLGLNEPGPPLARQLLAVDATAAPLLRADDGTPLALWRAEGQGRVALWWLADSFRLVLAGKSPAHASLWARSVHTLARARATSEPVLPTRARVDERAVLCGVAPGDSVRDARGTAVNLLIDPSTTGAVCAAYWPAEAGWHHLQSGDADWPFYAQPADAALALTRADTARATRALLGTAQTVSGITTRVHPQPRWPWFLAWLAAIALLWVVERKLARQDRGGR